MPSGKLLVLGAFGAALVLATRRKVASAVPSPSPGTGTTVEPTTDHERRIARAVLEGRAAPFQWSNVPCGRASLRVANDVLRIDGLRVGVTPRLAQALADHFGCAIPTPRMVDAIWLAASVTLDPHPQDPENPNAERLHSAAVDADLAKLGGAGLVATLGKNWVVCADSVLRSPHVANYGWLTNEPGTYAWSSQGRVPGSYWVLQPNPVDGASFKHNAVHWDYSQTWRPIRDACTIDGREASVATLLTMPGGGEELSWQGPLPRARLLSTTPSLKELAK